MADNFWETPEFQSEFNKNTPPAADSSAAGNFITAPDLSQPSHTGGKALSIYGQPGATPPPSNAGGDGTAGGVTPPPTDGGPTTAPGGAQEMSKNMFGPAARLSQAMSANPVVPFRPPATYSVDNPFALPDDSGQKKQVISAATPSWTDNLFHIIGLGFNLPKALIGNPDLPAPISGAAQWLAKWFPLAGSLARSAVAGLTYRNLTDPLTNPRAALGLDDPAAAAAYHDPIHQALGLDDAAAASGLADPARLAERVQRTAQIDSARNELNDSYQRAQAIWTNMFHPELEAKLQQAGVTDVGAFSPQAQAAQTQGFAALDNERWNAAYDKIIADNRGYTGMAQDDRRAAYSLLNAPGPLSAQDMQTATDLISKAQLATIKAAGWGDPTFAYTFNVDPAKRDAFRAALTEAEFQKRAPLDDYEVQRIKDHFVDPWEELPGELALDVFNALGLYEAPGHLLGQASRAIGNGLVGAMVEHPDGSLAALGHVLSEGKLGATLATQFGNFVSNVPVLGGITRWLTNETVRSASARLYGTAADSLNQMAGAAPDTNSFVEMLRKAGDGEVLTTASVGGRENAVFDSLRNIKTGGDTWAEMAARSGNDVREAAAARYTSQLKATPEFRALASDPLAQTRWLTAQVNDRLETLLDNPKVLVNGIAGQFSDAYRASHLIPGTRLLDDSLLAVVARKLGIFDQSKGGIEALNNVSQGLSHLWMEAASLARPGSSMTRNVNSMFQYFIGGGHLFDDLGSLLATDFAQAAARDVVLPTELSQALLARQLGGSGTIPERLLAGWKPELGPISTIVDRWNSLRNPNLAAALDLGAAATAGLADGKPLVDRLAGDPLGLPQDTGKGAIRGIRDAWQAWVGGWSDWNQAVTFNLRARMYHQVLNATYDRLETNALPKVFEMIQSDPKLYSIGLSIWNEAGKDPAKFQSLWDEFLGRSTSDFAAGKWSRLVPPDLTARIGGLTPADRALFMNNVLAQVQKAQAAGPLTEPVIRTLFGDVERQLSDYAVAAAARGPAPAVEAAAQSAVEATVQRGAAAARAKALAGSNTDRLVEAFRSGLAGRVTVRPATDLAGQLLRLGADNGQPLLEYDAAALARLRPAEARVRLYEGLSRLAVSQGGTELAGFGDAATLAGRLRTFLADPAAIQRADPKLAEALATVLDRNPELYTTLGGLSGKPPADYNLILRRTADEGYRLTPRDYQKVINDQVAARPYQTPAFVQTAGQSQAAARATASRTLQEAAAAGTLDPALHQTFNTSMTAIDRVQDRLHDWWLSFMPGPLAETGKVRRGAWDYFDELRAGNYQAVSDWTNNLRQSVLRGEPLTVPSMADQLTRSGIRIEYGPDGHIFQVTVPGANGGPARVFTTSTTTVGLEASLLHNEFPHGLPPGLTAQQAIELPFDQLETKARGYINAVRAPVDIPAAISADAPPAAALSSRGGPRPTKPGQPLARSYAGTVTRQQFENYLKSKVGFRLNARQVDEMMTQVDAEAAAWAVRHPDQDYWTSRLAGWVSWKGVKPPPDLPPEALTHLSPTSPEFGQFFGSSAVTKDDGRPLVVFHGTPERSEFSVFDKSKQDPAALYGPGFYFTEDPTVAGGAYQRNDKWTYHDTFDQAQAQPGRNYFVWKDETSGKWIAPIADDRPVRPWGYTRIRGSAYDQDMIAPIHEAIFGSDEYARMMGPGYLSPGERDNVHRTLMRFMDTGSRDALDVLTEQPYNLNVQHILERGGLAEAGPVMPVYLSIQNPFRLDAPLMQPQAEHLLRQAVSAGLIDQGGADRVLSHLELAGWNGKEFHNELALQAIQESASGTAYDAVGNAKRDVNQFLQDQGYDGLTHIGGANTGTPDHRVWIAFEPTQIKSATGNIGSWDPTNPSILRQTVDGIALHRAPRLPGGEGQVGLTYNPISNIQWRPGNQGFAVAVDPKFEQQIAPELFFKSNAQQGDLLAQYALDHTEELLLDNRYLGVYYGGSGPVYLDISEVYPDEYTAIQRGIQRGQESIYGFEHGDILYLDTELGRAAAAQNGASFARLVPSEGETARAVYTGGQGTVERVVSAPSGGITTRSENLSPTEFSNLVRYRNQLASETAEASAAGDGTRLGVLQQRLENTEALLRRTQYFADEAFPPDFWYLRSRQIINQKMRKATLQPAEAVSNFLKGQVSTDELRATGLDDFLAARAGRKVSLDQLNAHLDAHTPQLYEMVLGDEHVKPGPIPLAWTNFGETHQAVGYDGLGYYISEQRHGEAGPQWLLEDPDGSYHDGQWLFSSEAEAKQAAAQHELARYAADPHPEFSTNTPEYRRRYVQDLRTQYGDIDRWPAEHRATLRAMDANTNARAHAAELAQGPNPQYVAHTLGGGERYREFLLTWKPPADPSQQLLTDAYGQLSQVRGDLSSRYPDGWASPSDPQHYGASSTEGAVLPLGPNHATLSPAEDAQLQAAYDQLERANQALDDTALFNFNANVNDKLHARTAFHTSGLNTDYPIVVHIRAKDRIDDAGRKILAIEEIQSDWAQHARDYGIYTRAGQDKLDALNEAAQQARFDHNDLGDVIHHRTYPGQTSDDDFARLRQAQDRMDMLNEAHQMVQDLLNQTEAANPWQESYNNLALKYMTRKAAEDGDYAALAWTPGWAQADRYNLANYTNRIDWSVEPGKYSRAAEGVKTGDQLAQDYLDGRLPLEDYVAQFGQAPPSNTSLGVRLQYNDGGQTVALNKLHEYIGGDVANHIKSQLEAGVSDGSLVGDQLQVGGLGMNEVYDKKLPAAARRVTGATPYDLPLAYVNKQAPTYHVYQARPDTYARLQDNLTRAQSTVEALKAEITTALQGTPGFQASPERIKEVVDSAFGQGESGDLSSMEALAQIRDALKPTGSELVNMPVGSEAADAMLRANNTAARTRAAYHSIQDAEYNLSMFRQSNTPWVRSNSDRYYDLVNTFDTPQEAQDFRDEVQGRLPFNEPGAAVVPGQRIISRPVNFHAVDLSDSLKASARNGMPLFQTRGQVRAAVQFLDDGRAILHAFQGADFASLMHELAHVLRRHLDPPELDALATWSGKPVASWGRAEEEAFAKAAELYRQQGMAPTPALQGTFDYLKDYLTNVYASVQNSYFSGVKITPELRGIFDGWLGARELNPEQLAQALPGKALGLLRTDSDPLVHTAFKDTFRWMQNELRSVSPEGDFYSGLLREYPHWGDVIAGAPDYQNPRATLHQLLENEIVRVPGAPMDPETRALVGRLYDYAANELTNGTPYNPANPYLLTKLAAPPEVVADATAKFQAVHGISDAAAWLEQKRAADLEAELGRAWSAWSAAPRYADGRSLNEVWPADAVRSQGTFDSYLSDRIEHLRNQYGQRADDLVTALGYLQQEARSFGAQAISANRALLPDQLSAREAELARNYPVMIPYWQLPEDIKTWLGRAENIQAQAEGAADTLHYWRDWLVGQANHGDPMGQLLSDEQKTTARLWGEQAAKAKYDLLDTAVHGSGAQGVEGALPHTNKFMLNYGSQSNFDGMMRAVFPFWMMPSRSIPFYLEYMASHPWLPAAYSALLGTSQRQAYAAGATTSDGRPLPSLEGYLPLPGSNVWFNPTAALRFRYALPRAASSYNDVGENQTPLQQLYSYLDEMGRYMGFYLPPWVTIPATALGVQDANRLPNFSLVPELQLIPPWVESDVMEKISRAVSPNIKSLWYNYVNPTPPWQDYLVEREVLRGALAQMQSGSLSADQKMSLAYDARDALTQREGNPSYDQALRAVQDSAYGRSLAGFFTGVLPQQYSEGAAELASVRDEVNRLRDSVNSEANARLFGVEGDATQRYNHYVDARYNTPDGFLMSLYSAIRFTQTPAGQPVYGQPRRDLVAQTVSQDQTTAAYFSALAALSSELNARLSKLNVGGDPTVARSVWDWYFGARQQVEGDPLYADSKRGWVQGIKPDAMLAQHYTDLWYSMLRETQPKWDKTGGQTYTDWQASVQQWRDNLPATVASLADSFNTQAQSDALQANTNVEQHDALAKAGQIVANLTTTTTPASFDEWEKAKATPLDALNEAWRLNYWDPYWTTISGQKGYNYTLAEQQFLAAHPTAPSASQLADWVLASYPPGKFTREQLIAAAQSQGVQSIADRTAPASDDAALQQRAYTILSEAGPGAGQTALITAFIKAGGSRSDISTFYDTGGAWKDPARLKTFVDELTAAANTLSLKPPSTDQLARWIAVQSLNDRWKQQAAQQFGADILTVISDYGAASTKARTAMRKADPRINQFYTAKDAYGTAHPEWAIYYDTYIAQKLGLNPADFGGSGALVNPATGQAYATAATTTTGSGGATTTRRATTTAAARRAATAAARAAAGPAPLTIVQRQAAITRSFIPMARRSTMNLFDLLDAAKLGSGKLGGDPRWPDTLWEQYGAPPPGLTGALGTTAIAALAAGNLNQPLKQFLSGLAGTNPNWSPYLNGIVNHPPAGDREAVPTPHGGAGSQANYPPPAPPPLGGDRGALPPRP